LYNTGGGEAAAAAAGGNRAEAETEEAGTATALRRVFGAAE
jgi:hypothetical protein